MSTYRDDREALRARVDALESELHEAKTTAASQRADYERQLGRTAPPAPKGNAGWLLGGVALVLLVGTSILMFATVQAPAPVVAPRFTPAKPPEPMPTPVFVAPPTPAPTQRLATVQSATGIALPRGTSCQVAVDSGSRVQRVRCGDHELYTRRLTVDPGVNVFGDGERDSVVASSARNDTVTLTREAPALKVVLHLATD